MKVFISYSQADKALARRLADSLRDAGLDVWRDEDQLFPGDNWSLEIGKALADSDAMVVLMTSKGAQSEFVQREVTYAIGNPRLEGRLAPVIPRGEQASIPTVPWLRAVRSVVIDENRIEEGAKEVAVVLSAA